MRHFIMIGCLLLASGLMACGDQMQDPNGQADNRGVTDGLIGKWTGNFDPVEKEVGTSLKEKTTAKVEFTTTDKQTGDFIIELPLLEGVSTKGTYTDFGDELLLQVKESNNSLIGLPGSSPSLKYELIGPALRLYNNRVSIRLARSTGDDSNGSGSGGGNSDEDDLDGLVAEWTCNDSVSGNTWRLRIESATKFALDIAHTGSRTIWQRGEVEAGKNEVAAILTVTESLNSRYDGNTYDVMRVSDEAITIKIVKSGGSEVGREISCSK